MNVLEIVSAYLIKREYDGLWNADGECACKIGELSPVHCMTDQCRPGHTQPCPKDCGEHDWHIGTKSEEAEG